MTQELIYSLWTLSIVIDLASVVIDCNLHIFLPACHWLVIAWIGPERKDRESV